MLKKVRVRPIKIGALKLQFVKKIKEHSGLGLKEAKDWCDNISRRDLPYHEISIYTTPQELKADLNSLEGYLFDIDDNESRRNLKLISLGLGDKKDKIDLISEDAAMKLLHKVRSHLSHSHGEAYEIYCDFMKEFLVDYSDENLDNIITEKLKKINDDRDKS